MAAQPREATDAWRILLFGRNGTELLVLQTASGFRLPELRIPSEERIAANLNREVLRLWKLQAVSLFPIDDGAPGAPKYHVMEASDSEGLARLAPDSLRISRLEEASFADERDSAAVRLGMRFDASVREAYRGPFSEFGSFEKIRAWVKAELEPLGLRLDGSFRQLQASPCFALIRFETGGGAVWFKAVGEPNTREFRVTAELTARFPAYLPVSIATQSEWNAWLVREADGQDLFHSADTAWQRAAESLAELQVASIPHARDLLAAGARDVRAGFLETLAESFFKVMERMMLQQTKAAPAPLDAQEIREVKEHVVSLLQFVKFASIPETLNHFDPNPGNIFVSGSASKFLDWAEAAVGNPFFTFEYLRQHFRRAFPGAETREAELCHSYLRRWTPLLPPQTVERMIRITPLVALFAYAVSTLPWDGGPVRNQSKLQAFLRSLVRRMHQESQFLKKSTSAESRSRSACHGNDLSSVCRASES
jgi:hypothetical protein